MIDSVSIRDFQSLRDVDLPLGRFTALVGESDVGKSAVIRAIRAFVTNPGGQDIITFGQKVARVRLKGPDYDFLWMKGESARYASEGEGWDKVRPGSVPEAVALKVAISDVDLDGFTVHPNFHLQLDSPFLVYDNPTQRAKAIGEVSGANKVQAGSVEARRLAGQHQRKVTEAQAELEKTREDLRRYEALAIAEAALKAAEAATAEFNETLVRVEALRAHIGAQDRRTSRCSALAEQLGQVSIPEAPELAPVQALREVLSGLESRAVQVASAKSDVSIPSTPELIPVDSLRRIVEEWETVSTAWKRAASQRGLYVTELAAVEAEISEIPRCPTCGQEVSA